MRLDRLHALSREQAKDAFYQCCASASWAKQMSESMPFASDSDLFARADQIWASCGQNEVLEAFAHHPRIGGNPSTQAWASQEQKGVQGASGAVLQALSDGNVEYEKRFGFVFLICATGKSAEEMLEALRRRLPNSKEQEFENAKAEQGKITVIRLKKLIEEMQ